MNKKTFIFAAVFAAAVSSMAFVQTRQRTEGGGTGGVYSAGGGTVQIAKEADSKLNPVQEMLSRLICSHQNLYVVMGEENNTVSEVILEHCTAQMWLRTPAQQEYEKKVVFELDKYRPGKGPWDQVRNAPSLAKALLKVTPEQETAIAAINEKHVDIFLSAVQKPGYRDGKTEAQLWSIALKRTEAEAAEVYKLLNAEQKKEWDALLTRSVNNMKAALNKKAP